MLDKEKYARVLSGEEFEQDRGVLGRLDGLTNSELIALRDEIEKAIPTLATMDLEKEVTELYLQAKDLYQRTIEDDRVPPNQAAQTVNSCSSALQSLVRMQTEFQTAERFKLVEALMIKYMKKLPKEVAEAFVDEYERIEGE